MKFLEKLDKWNYKREIKQSIKLYERMIKNRQEMMKWEEEQKLDYSNCLTELIKFQESQTDPSIIERINKGILEYKRWINEMDEQLKEDRLRIEKYQNKITSIKEEYKDDLRPIMSWKDL